MPISAQPRIWGRRAYTLLEVLVTVTILGIMGTMVVPAVGGAASLRSRAAVRTVISDITKLQTDAMAFQRGRAIIFDVDANSYVGYEVNGDLIDLDNDLLFDPDFPDGVMRRNLSGEEFGGARLTGVTIDGGSILIFDEMGAPIVAPGDSSPSTGGTITLRGQEETYILTVDGFTGHIRSERIRDADPV